MFVPLCCTLTSRSTGQLGYTSAFFRLDNASSLTYGPDKPNVLAVFVDATEAQVNGDGE